MNKKIKSGFLYVVLLIFIVVAISMGVYINKTKENNKIITENEIQNRENNSVNNAEKELETEPQDLVDESPVDIVQTPGEEETDDVKSDKSTL